MNIHTLLRETPDYPTELHRLEDPPAQLRVKGTLPSRERMVAIVGTRAASARAGAFAEELAERLAGAGSSIVSGGALGIDTHAHEGALQGGGATIVVQAPGLGHLYPSENLPLFDRVLAAGGCVLSEHADEAPPLRRFFLARNRIIAALARVVVVVEAPFPSGALSTAHAALKVGSALLVVPAFPSETQCEGSNLLLRAGARVCLGVDDVLSALDGAPAPLPLPEHIRTRPKKARATPKKATSMQSVLALDLPPELAALLEFVGDETLDLDTLAARTGLAFDALQARVTQLELHGALNLDHGGRVRRTTPNR